ncbi:hypothetical protein BsWGS_23378 [Bradybaena similaris]
MTVRRVSASEFKAQVIALIQIHVNAVVEHLNYVIRYWDDLRASGREPTGEELADIEMVAGEMNKCMETLAERGLNGPMQTIHILRQSLVSRLPPAQQARFPCKCGVCDKHLTEY